MMSEGHINASRSILHGADVRSYWPPLSWSTHEVTEVCVCVWLWGWGGGVGVKQVTFCQCFDVNKADGNGCSWKWIAPMSHLQMDACLSDVFLM